MLWDDLKREIDELKGKNLLRSLRSPCADTADFKSNDYLGLSKHPEVVSAAADAALKFGAGARASRLVSGSLSIHASLEEKLAQFKKTEDALVFPSGFQTNLGTVSALAGSGDFIALDHLSHASLIDSVRLSGAAFRTYVHLDCGRLEAVLASRDAVKARRRFIITDGLFSMDGDIANIPAILALAARTDSYLIVDDAHGTGTLGATGRGTLEFFGVLPDERTILIGTLSKALGAQGGFVACKGALKEYLINKCRAFIYSTGLNPSSSAAASAALDIIKREPERVARLRDNCEFFRAFFKDDLYISNMPATPIVPIVFGGEDAVVRAAENLAQKGIFVAAIRPPTVKPGMARLRISISSEHSKAELQRLAEEIISVRKTAPHI